MNNINDLIKQIYEIQEEINSKKDEINKLKESELSLEDKLNELNTILLTNMVSENKSEIQTDNLIALYFRKNEFSYGDETALLNYLKNNGLDKYVAVKTTTKESINKNSLKKDLKINSELKESLKDFVGDRVTEYVVVTTEENHKKMLEHIENAKK